MSDYTNSFGGAAKDSGQDIILGVDLDTELESVATASGTKANKVVSGTEDNVVTLTATGDVQDSGVTGTELAILDGATVTTAELNILDGATLDVTELNYVDGVTSAIQTQIDGKIADSADAVTSTHLATNSVTADAIASGAVGSAEIATNAVGTAELQDGVVRSDIATTSLVGGIGTYAMCKASGTTFTAGGTGSASYLEYSSASGTSVSSPAMSGTWQAMGNCPNGQVSLFLRIS